MVNALSTIQIILILICLLLYVPRAWLNIMSKLTSIFWVISGQMSATMTWRRSTKCNPFLILRGFCTCLWPTHQCIHRQSQTAVTNISSSLLRQCFMQCVWSSPPRTEKRSFAGVVCAGCAFLQRAQFQKGTDFCPLVHHQVHPWG